MFRLTVSDHIMIAHSIRGAVLEPARMLHGNTLVVEVEFRAAALDALNFLIDFNLAKAELRRILDRAPLYSPAMPGSGSIESSANTRSVIVRMARNG